MPPVATYSKINYDNDNMNHKLLIRNNSHINKDNRKKVIILEDSLLNCINKKVLSKKKISRLQEKQ